MTQEELREALLEALLDYETLKKTRRLKAVKKALQGTMVATVIGSTGLMAAGQSSRTNNQVKENSSIVALNPNLTASNPTTFQESSQLKAIPAVAHFAFDSHSLAPDQEERLAELIKQIPKGSEITVIGRTDAKGKKGYNKRLGEQRGQAVADYFSRHGMKVKTVGSKVSEEVRFSWMARRVDILVDPGSQPFLVNLLPQEERISFLQPNSQAQPAVSTIAFQEKVKQPLPKVEKPAIIDEVKSAEVIPTSDQNASKSDSAQADAYRQQIRGITHFAVNRHTLASAHKERLIELIKQLPREAELTVIGRTDASGGDDHNNGLGIQRAKSVANFLASQGVKIKAVGSKVSNERETGWMARRVDIVVESLKTPVTINLAAPVVREKNDRIKATLQAQTHSKNPGQGKKLNVQADSIEQLNTKKASVIGKETSRLIQRARNIHNARQTEQTFDDNPSWWGNGAKVNNECLDKATSVKESLNCFPK